MRVTLACAVVGVYGAAGWVAADWDGGEGGGWGARKRGLRRRVRNTVHGVCMCVVWHGRGRVDLTMRSSCVYILYHFMSSRLGTESCTTWVGWMVECRKGGLAGRRPC